MECDGGGVECDGVMGVGGWGDWGGMVMGVGWSVMGWGEGGGVDGGGG